MRTVAEMVVAEKLNPAQALEKARANGIHVVVSHGTTRRYLREFGLNRSVTRYGRRAYRSFEAAAPGDIFQFDISGVKERWLDLKTRRLLHVSPLEVSRNHPNQKVTRIGVWKFVIIDDHSRYLFTRFIARPSIDSNIVMDFLLEAFGEMGVPKMLYVDNDAKILSRQMRRAESILDRAFADHGGFRIEPHLAGNPQASGKVERAHQWIEENERFIGAADRVLSIDELGVFARRLCVKHNAEAHRQTGMMPFIRFKLNREPQRFLDITEKLHHAFKSVEIERELRPAMTISVDGKVYQLPSGATLSDGRRNPLVDWVGEKIAIVWPSDADYFVVLGLAKLSPAERGEAIEIERRIARADVAGEFKTPAESVGQRAAKELVESHREKRVARKAAGQVLATPGVDVPFELPAAAAMYADAESVPGAVATGSAPAAMFPRKRVTTDASLLAALGSDVVPPSAIDGKLFDYYQALKLFIDEELLQPTEFDRAWLRQQFGGDVDGVMSEIDLRAAIESRAAIRSVEAKSA